MSSSKPCSSFSTEFFAAATRSQLWLVAAVAALFLGLLCLSGCAHGRRVVLVHSQGSNTVMRAADDVRGHVYFFNGEAWERSRNQVNIPEGFVIHALTEP